MRNGGGGHTSVCAKGCRRACAQGGVLLRDRARRDEDEARVAEATVAATVAAMAAVAMATVEGATVGGVGQGATAAGCKCGRLAGAQAPRRAP